MLDVFDFILILFWFILNIFTYFDIILILFWFIFDYFQSWHPCFDYLFDYLFDLFLVIWKIIKFTVLPGFGGFNSPQWNWELPEANDQYNLRELLTPIIRKGRVRVLGRVRTAPHGHDCAKADLSSRGGFEFQIVKKHKEL